MMRGLNSCHRIFRVSHKAKKRFGQNFLHDQNVITRIVNCIAPSSDEHLVEIGPGQGAITIEILKLIGKMTAVELDRDLLTPLEETCGKYGKLTLHNADALKFDFTELVEGDQKLRLIGNLPYNISTPILFHLLESKKIIHDMHFMLQKEVVDRMAAQPGSKTYGRLSVMIQVYCQVSSLFDIPPSAFNPAPKVDSSIVRLVPHDKPTIEIKDQNNFSRIVTASFAHRRKTLRNNLKGIIAEENIASLDIDPSRRAETLSLEEFARLAQQTEK